MQAGAFKDPYMYAKVYIYVQDGAEGAPCMASNAVPRLLEKGQNS